MLHTLKSLTTSEIKNLSVIRTIFKVTYHDIELYILTLFLTSVDHWLKAGILLADSAVILCDGPVQNGDGNQQEHMMDAGHIMVVQKLSTLFPNVNIVIDIHYRYNMRFLKYAKKNLDFPGLKSISRAIVSLCIIYLH